MSREKTIPANDLSSEWRKDPDYVAKCDPVEEEFAIASAMIAPRSHAGLTQAELGKRMGTTQSVIARLEAGKPKPSTSTLEKLAKATGTKLRISFEPENVQPA